MKTATQKVLSLIFGLSIGLCVTAQPTVTVGPYLQSPTPSSIKIKWRSDVAATSMVMYGTSPNSLTMSATEPTATTWHTVQVSGLNPHTRYYYAIYNGTTFAEGGDSMHTFRTFPVAGTDVHVRAWGIGDFGKGNDKQVRVRQAYENFDDEETDLWLWMGDNVYDNGLESEYLAKVFDTVWGYRDMMKSLPFEPCPGNHDYNTISPIQAPTPPLTHAGPYFDLVDVYQNAEAGGVATGHELFYSFDYGNVHFVSLNSELGSLFNAADDWTGIYLFGGFSGSPMTQWLHADLTANTKPWVVVYFHQPPYTDGSHDAGAFWEVLMQAMRENFAEIWEQYGVDLVVCGHSHVYERSFLVKGAYGNAANITSANILQGTSGVDSIGEAYVKYTQGPNANEGTVYVVQGNSGSVDDAPSFQHPYMIAEYGCDTCAGSFILDVDSNRLDGRHIDMNGEVRDHFTIVKMNAVAVQAHFPAFEMSIGPNPFHTTTTVAFELPEFSDVHLRLSDATGRTWKIFDGSLPQGRQSLLIDAQKLNLARGAYIATLSIGELRVSKAIRLQ
jgi:acid phosphatase type 7